MARLAEEERRTEALEALPAALQDAQAALEAAEARCAEKEAAVRGDGGFVLSCVWGYC